MHISSKFSGDADIVKTILWEPLPYMKGFHEDKLDHVSKVATTDLNLWFSKSGNLVWSKSQFNFCISTSGVRETEKP